MKSANSELTLQSIGSPQAIPAQALVLSLSGRWAQMHWDMNIWRRILPTIEANLFFGKRKAGNLASGAAIITQGRIDRAEGLQPDTALSFAAQFCNTCKVVMIGLNAKKTQDVLREKAINGCSVIIPGLTPWHRWVGYLALSFWLTATAAAEITITSPTAKQFVQPGYPLTITWGSSETAAGFILEYSADDGTNWVRIPSADFVATGSTGNASLQSAIWSLPFVREANWPSSWWFNGSPASYSKIRVTAVSIAPPSGSSSVSPLAQAEIGISVGPRDERRRLVVITHGFILEGLFPDWPEQMAREILKRTGGGKIIRLNHDGAVASVIEGDGLPSELHPTAATVVIYDWARVSNNLVVPLDPFDGDNSPATPGWREAAGDLLANFLLGSGIVQNANQAGNNQQGHANIPIQFIGHSFGTVVTSQAIRRLAFSGIVVDQMTTLDPHDINQREVADAEHDPLVAVWSNVRFADNYWQDNVGSQNDPSDGGNELLPVGHSLLNAYNRNLTDETRNRLLQNEWPHSPHSRVWSWYFKTIGGIDVTDDVQELPDPAWYGGSDPLEFGFKLTQPSSRPENAVNKGSVPEVSQSVFNGDFELHIENSRAALFPNFRQYEIPGYDESLGVTLLGLPWLHNIGGNIGYVARLKSADNTVVQHKPVWIPTDAQHLEVDVYFLTYTSNGKLKVSLLNADNGQGASLQTPWESDTNETLNVWRTIQVPLDASTTRGRWAWLKFEVDPAVGDQTEVYIDNLRLVQPVPTFTGFTVNGIQSADLPGALVYLPAAGDITLSTSATGSAVYQWFRKAAGTGTFVALVNDALFSGVTSQQLTIKNPTTAYNGDEYRVEVSNAGGTATSNSIILTLGSDQTGELIGDYRFEGNVNDYSGHGATGTANGGVTYGAGMNGQAIELNGTNGYIDLPNVILRPMTASAWIKLDSDAVFGQVSTDPSIQTVAVIDGWKDRENFMLRIRKEANGTLRAMASFHDWVGPTNEGSFESYDELHIQSARVLEFGAWYHLAMTYDGSVLNLYVNGQLEATANRPTTPYPVYTAATPDIRIGVHRFNNGYFKGSIDDVMLATRAYSSAEVSDLAGLTNLSSGMAASYSFDGNFNDSSGNTNNGTITGGVTFGAGITGQAAQFDGSTGFINVGTRALDNVESGDFTLAIWVKGGPFTGETIILQKQFSAPAGANPGWFLETYPGNLVRYARYTIENGTLTWGTPLISTTQIGDGQWHHIAVTRQGSQTSLFVDGILEASAATGSGVATNTADLGIGRRNAFSDMYFTGLLDDFRIYTRALTQPEIAALSSIGGGSGESYIVTTFAGTQGSAGSADGAGSAARFNGPVSTAVDGSGNVYVAEYGNHTIRKISSGGVVTTLAGTAGSPGSDEGTGSAARFNNPVGVAVDGNGNVFVADSGNHTIRKITAGGVVTTLAGTAGNAGGANGTGSAAQFNNPHGLAVDVSGTVFVADTSNRTIRKVTSGGVVTTLAGSAGISGGADGTGDAARFSYPLGVAVDADGNLFVSDDNNNHSIRKVTASGSVTTLAGAGSVGSEDGTGTAARFYQPYGVAVTGNGNVFVADSNNHTIRKITASGVVTTIAGAAGITGSADGSGSVARFAIASSVTIDGSGNFYVADYGNHTIRKITVSGAATAQATLVLQASPSDGGSVTGAGTYAVNSTQTISATPSAAWTFAGWNDGSMVNPRQVTLPAEGTTYTANFSLVVPTAGAASETTTTSFQANWSALSGISGLRLDVATDAAFSNFLAGYSNRDINGNSSNEPVTGLNPGTTYYYRLRAYVPGAISENSAVITVTTTIPTAPVPFAQAASNVTLTSFQANWAGVSGAQGLRLDVASDVAFSNFVAGYNNRDINGNAYNEVVTGLNPGTDYYYRLRSYVLGDITSSDSNVITVSTGMSAHQLWQQSKFTSSERLDANISGSNADPDRDGYSNLIEYALGLEPKAVNTSGLPGTSVQGSDWVFTYTRPSDRTDLTYAVECSTNLTSWSTAGVAHELVSSSSGTETWRGRYPLASAGNVFFRLRVTGQ